MVMIQYHDDMEAPMKRIAAFRGTFLISALITIFLCMPAAAAEKLTRIADNVYSYVDEKNGSKDNSFGSVVHYTAME